MRAVWQPESVTRRMSEITSTALLWGYDALELRSVGGAEDRIPHVSERLIRTSCLEADLPVAAVDPEYFSGSALEKAAWMNELATLPEVIRLAGRIGCPGIIIGSFCQDREDTGEERDATPDATADNLPGNLPDALQEALHRIFRDAGRLAERAGLDLHVRTGPPGREALVAEAVQSAGAASVRLMPEIVVGTEDGSVYIPAYTGEAAYVRLLYRGASTISMGGTDRLRDVFRSVVRGLADTGFESDVCLEFEQRPEPASGLRVSTAFVSAVQEA